MEENFTVNFEDETMFGASEVTMAANVSNFSVWLYIEQHLGPQKLPISIVLPITVVYALIFISGCIGNAIVCAVIARNSHFQTPTDYYLFSLAISDLLFLVFGLPNDLKVYWQQYPWGLGEAVCKFRAFIAEMTSYASVLTIVAFTIERYIAICHPLFIQTVSTLPRAIKFITSVWIISSLSALPLVYYAQINYLEYPPGSGKNLEESAYCGLPMEIQNITRPLLETATFVFFLLPLSVILILYIKISIKLRSTKFARMTYTSSSRCSSVASTYSPEVRKTTVRRSVNKMLIAVVIAFFICWAPFHAQRLLAVYVAPQNWTTDLRMANEVLYYAAGCLYYFSATINPILYSSMSSKYRGAFLNILTCFSKNRKASSGSLFRTTGHLGSETSHPEKEPSLRISKQSFEADSSLLEFRSKKCYHSMSKNHLDVPDKNRAASLIADYRYRNRADVDNMSFIKISPEGKLDDTLQQNGCIETERNRKSFLYKNSPTCERNKEPDATKKDLIVTASEGKYRNSLEGLECFKNSTCAENNIKQQNENEESVV